MHFVSCVNCASERHASTQVTHAISQATQASRHAVNDFECDWGWMEGDDSAFSIFCIATPEFEGTTASTSIHRAMIVVNPRHSSTTTEVNLHSCELRHLHRSAIPFGGHFPILHRARFHFPHRGRIRMSSVHVTHALHVFMTGHALVLCECDSRGHDQCDTYS